MNDLNTRVEFHIVTHSDTCETLPVQVCGDQANTAALQDTWLTHRAAGPAGSEPVKEQDLDCGIGCVQTARGGVLFQVSV